MPKPRKWQRVGLRVTACNRGTRRTRRAVWNPSGTTSRADVPTVVLPPATDFERADSSCLQSEEPESGVSKHQQRKEQVKEAWADQREELIKTGINLAKPPTTSCYFCGHEVVSPIIYCQDCSPVGIFCLSCFESCHQSPSLHCPSVWKKSCMRHKETRSLKVFDHTGRLQYVDVDVCWCESELATLLRLGLWASTPTKPQTAFSVSLLEWLCVFSMVGQVSVEAFCQAMRWKNHLTLKEMNTLHRALTGESIAEFQHYRDRMCSMKDLTPLLDDGTTCPACSKADGEQIVAIDGNFGLVRKASSGVSSGDPLHGTTLFFDDEKVKEFVNNYRDDEKPAEDCSNFKAGNCLRSKSQQKKLDVTGVFGSVCRHDIPLKFLNMFHGERFGYPVYLIKQLLEDATLRNVRLRVIYDVSCSLEAHLKHTKQTELLDKLSLAVDVFHSYGHNPLCQVKYSTRRLSGYGLTDGEGVERMWAYLRKFSRMSKEMSPDHRIDKLSDALRHYATFKVVDIEVSLKMKLDKAVKAERIAEDNLQQARVQAGGTFSMEDVEAWRETEKLMMERRKQKTTSTPKWHRDYVASRVRYDTLRKTILECQDASALAVHHSAFMKLETTLKAIEGKHKIKRWQETDPQYIAALKDLDLEERTRQLAAMRSASYKRSFLISLKQRYPDGQGIALKLSKQLTSASKKLAQTIQAYNNIQWERQTPEFPASVTFEAASDPAWESYQSLDTSMGEPGLPYSLKRKAIDAVNLRERALEEQDMLKAEMHRVLRHLMAQQEATQQGITEFQMNNMGEDDDVYKSLFSHDDPEIKRLTCPALKNIMTEFVVITERMLKDYRTGGIFHNPTEEQREEMVKCHTNNTGLERTFAHLDRDVGTGQYLDTIPMEEKRTVFKEARKAARTDRKLHQEEQMQLKQHRHELLRAWIQKQTLKKAVKEAALEALKSTVKQLGLWDSAEQIEAGLLKLVTKSLGCWH
ncbi:hypothetical protein Bbelb_070410 [Branchiostoma belcheri]|nr:hypothetical protein Bbelb_070410 [Branchiostoma belcheri]